MTHSNPKLVPTTVTDKNGKVTTVHKKSETTVASRSGVPAPKLSAKQAAHESKASRVRRITHALESDEFDRHVVKAKVERFLASSTPEQLSVLDEAVSESFDASSPHEKRVVASILSPFSANRRSTKIIIELLTLRKAFASDWAKRTEPRQQIHDLDAFIYGLREEQSKAPLDLTDEKTNEQNIALLRFAYELKERAPYGGFLPVAIKADNLREQVAYVYDSEDLANLIRKYPERVDEMIQFALDNETCQAHRLRALVEHEGHSSMTSGWL